MKLYKVLNENLSAIYGSGSWIENGWMPPIKGELVPCENGYHLCRSQDLMHWLGPVIYEAEYKGEIVESEDKVVAREARLIKKLDNWHEKTQRLFACDCAEHVLPIYEKEYPNDLRVRDCIYAARLFANGKATEAELASARAAAGAAGATAWDAARAAGAASAAWAAADAARAAARAAAGAAGAARDAADAARDAAGVAARAAWAAGDAEHEWQTERLFDYLEGRV